MTPRREWYRYHHLFADLLRHELDREAGSEVAELHRRASTWYAEAGSVDDAVRHATAAGDSAVAGELVARHWLPFLEMARPETVVAWVDALPPEEVAADTRLGQARAASQLFLGRLDEIERWLEVPRAATPAGPLWQGVASIESGDEMIRTTLRYLIGDLG